ncbi:MAG: cysteine hydrolase [Vicinamibacteria bacterium]|nr:cysteine hydrolase [Vicinamibacteria bacterium]
MGQLGSYTEDDVLQLARKTYDTGTASFGPDLRRAALLIIDMQDEFVRPGWAPCWVPEATRIIPRIAAVLAAARRAGTPVIHTAFADTHAFRDRPKSGAFMPNRYPGEPADGLCVTPRFPAELTPRSEEILILKPSYGAFYDTPLDTILRNLERDTVIVTGTMTNLCCSTTARQAYERGYFVVFGSDVTATNDAEIQAAEIRTQRYGFSRVLSGVEITNLLDGLSA